MVTCSRVSVRGPTPYFTELNIIIQTENWEKVTRTGRHPRFVKRTPSMSLAMSLVTLLYPRVADIGHNPLKQIFRLCLSSGGSS